MKKSENNIESFNLHSSNAFSIDVTNNTNKTKKVKLFDWLNIDEPNYGNDNGVEIKSIVPNVTYKQIATQFKIEEQEIALIRLVCDNTKQFNNDIEFYSEKEKIQQIKPSDYAYKFDENNKEDISDIVEIPFKYLYNEKIRIEIEILPQTTVRFKLFPTPSVTEKVIISKEGLNKIYNDKPILKTALKIVNTSNEKRKAVLFGWSNNNKKPNFGSDKDIKITGVFTNHDYDFILSESAFGFEIEHIKLESKNTKQLKNIIEITCKTMGGNVLTSFIYADDYINKNQKDRTFNDIKYNIIINRQTEIVLEIEPNTELFVSLFEPIYLGIGREINI